MEPEPTRRLAVLLHADVVGSTALVQENETLAHQRIRGTFQRFSEAINIQGGATREVRGDALVAEFPSASDAVEAALSFQAENRVCLNELSDNIKPILRVGIAMGEVVVADDTVTGEAVVLAQRLEQLAEPGGVCIQGTARDTVPKRLPYVYGQLDEQTLKGFSEPVRAFAVSRRLELPGVVPVVATLPDPVELKLPEEPSIAVLPFNNMSGDPEQDYFSDGITEDIIAALSRISGLLVIARNSTMVYKGKSVDIKQVGREQGVRYVLEGSVRKASNRVRVTAQLIDAATGHHQWAERYDRKLDDIFEVQDDITRHITVEMSAELARGESARLSAHGTDSVEAWELVCRSSLLIAREIHEENLEARRLAEQALQIDAYANAWVALGWTHWMDIFWGRTRDREHSLAQLDECIQKALSIEDDNPDVLGLLGSMHQCRNEHEQTVKVMERAVSLAPNHAENNSLLSIALFYAGRFEESVEKIRRAIRLSPICPTWYLAQLGACYHLMNQQELAIGTLRRGVELEPNAPLCRLWLASALVETGALEEAKGVGREALRCEPTFSVNEWGDLSFEDTSIRRRVIENLVAAGLPE